MHQMFLHCYIIISILIAIIDIILFHDVEVLNIPLIGNRPAGVGVKVMTVRTADEKRLTVDKNLFTDDFDLPE